MRHYGIIGYPLEHSLSASYFNELFAREGIDAEYSLYPVDNGQWTMDNGRQVRELLQRLDGANITYPYKQRVIPYLRQLDKSAEQIGAVNVVKQGVGYNTDYIGFVESMRDLIRPYDRRALVLGTGGASLAVCHGLQALGISSTRVSRTESTSILDYTMLDAAVMEAHTIIVNCTPLGMYPDVDSCPPIPYELLTERHLLYDCVYNPEETLFLKQGKAQGAQTVNGLAMLIGQAQAAWEIWKGNYKELR